MVRSIINKGLDFCVPKEATADAPLTPGVGVTRTGEDTVAAGGGPSLLISYNNRDFGQSKDEDYEAGERVKFVNPPKGVEAEVVVVNDTGAALTVTARSDTLAASGTGEFTPAAGDDVLALEGADLADGETARLQVEVL